LKAKQKTASIEASVKTTRRARIRDTYLIESIFIFALIIISGVTIGYLFSSDLNFSKHHFLYSSLVGIGFIAKLFGIGGGAGVSLRVLYFFYRQRDLNEKTIKRDIYWACCCAVYTLFGISILAIPYA